MVFSAETGREKKKRKKERGDNSISIHVGDANAISVLFPYLNLRA